MYKPQPHQLTAYAMFLTIVASYLIMAIWFPVAFIWATYEDLFGEWAQTWFFSAACLFAVLLALSRSSHRLFFGLLALALFYTVMEEISWGQRIFDFTSPEFFKRYNLQRETNLHNILVGPVSTGTKEIIEYTMAIGLGLYGLVYPLSLRLGWKPACWLYQLGIAAPPLYLWPFFVTGSVLEFGWFSFNEAEVAELLIGLAFSIMTAHYWLAHRRQSNVHAPPRWNRPVSRRLSTITVGIFLAVTTLSTATTYAMYSDPARQARIDARLLNGFEKYAKRYARYGRWDVSAELYLQVHKKEPRRTFIMRRLANAYRELGDNKRFLLYANKALDIALQKYAENPDKTSVNLTLARTYRLLGDTGKSREHAQRAHQIALNRVRQKPDSAHQAYWLGKTFKELGNYQAAKEQFHKAFRAKPSSKKYRKAYYNMKQVAG